MANSSRGKSRTSDKGKLRWARYHHWDSWNSLKNIKFFPRSLITQPAENDTSNHMTVSNQVPSDVLIKILYYIPAD